MHIVSNLVTFFWGTENGIFSRTLFSKSEWELRLPSLKKEKREKKKSTTKMIHTIRAIRMLIIALCKNQTNSAVMCEVHVNLLLLSLIFFPMSRLSQATHFFRNSILKFKSLTSTLWYYHVLFETWKPPFSFTVLWYTFYVIWKKFKMTRKLVIVH